MHVIVVEAGAASGVHAELWLADELMAVAFLYDGRLQLRIVPRPDGEPWLLEAAGLTLALEGAERRIAADEW